MSRRRRRLLRDDVVAPWIAIVVIVGLWWFGAHLLRPATAPDPYVAQGAEAPARTASVPLSEAEPAAVRPGTMAENKADVEPPENVVADSKRGASTSAPVTPSLVAEEVSDLIAQRLVVPVAGMPVASLRSSFEESRNGRKHEAMDILAPRGTPVAAVNDGRIAKLFNSARGGLTIYQFDPSERFTFYYAHLDGYAPGLVQGQLVTRGQTIGYVGTTGNAPPGTPHLHFAIFILGPEKKWWEGTAIDPYLVLR